jgi:hypothetical protein
MARGEKAQALESALIKAFSAEAWQDAGIVRWFLSIETL